MMNQTHNVIRGETMESIAAKYKVSLAELIAANQQVRNPNRIFPGQQINIPQSTVKSIESAGDAALSDGQLKTIMPKLPKAKRAIYLPLLIAAMAEFKINTLLRKAAFLAQLAHESLELNLFQEIATGEAYERRQDLGNTQPGDGKKFKGRGPIQLTGRFNYRQAGLALGLALEDNPKMAADPQHAFRIAGWFWQSRELNTLADEPNFDEITRRINGGYNGKAKREEYYKRALSVLKGG
jgi:spore coat assembly protein SafA